MDAARLDALRRVYRDGLLLDTLPFWLRHAADHEHGGFQFCLDRDGSVVDTDKGMWQHGRFTWLLATLYATVEKRDEWLAMARHGLAFLERHGFDDDGRMWFQVTREGRPLRRRRYVFTEMFAVAAFAAVAEATGEQRLRDRALSLFRFVDRCLTTPGLLPPKVNAEVRPQQSLGPLMIMLSTAQILRRVCDDPLCERWIEHCIAGIRRDFVRPEFAAVLETVGADGQPLEHFDGRTLNPGHAIEAAWFLLDEARHRGGDGGLRQLATTMLDWMWARGWDREHGGILYFTDLDGRPIQEYWHDMKFWWPQCEAIIATLMAWTDTGDAKYAQWHGDIHDWAHARFPDPEHGEWFGYLHRDGRLSSTLKGNLWKGPFHVPRMQLRCWQLVEELRQRPTATDDP